MKIPSTHSVPWLGLSSLACAALAQAQAVLVVPAAQAPAQRGGLARIASAQDPHAAQRAFAARDWSARLAERDLDARERACDELLGLAQRDASARRWIEQTAHDAQSDLSWTCRLLLRLLDSPGRPSGSFGPSFGSPFGNQGFFHAVPPAFPQGPSDLQDLGQRMQQLFDELQGRLDGLPGQPGSAPAPGQPSGPRGLPGVQDSSRSVQMEQGPDGCKVTISEDVDGKRETKTYSATSLEELLEAHPELREKIGLQVLRPGASLLNRWPGFDADGGDAAWLFRAPQGGNGGGAWGAPLDGPLRTDVLGVVVTAVPSARATALGLPEGRGLLVQRAEPGTIASVLGLSGGDVLVELNGREIHASEEIKAVLRERAAGADLSVSWYDAWGKLRTRTWRDGAGESQPAEAGQEGASNERSETGERRPLRLPKQDA
jgi:hypothetical protein